MLRRRTQNAALPKITPANAGELPQKSRYALRIDGDALAPRLPNGTEIVIEPKPKVITAGDTILAEVTAPNEATSAAHVGVYFINGDGDLWPPSGLFHASGTFRIGGLVVGTQRSVE